jgi:hypothetical protein
MMTTAIPKRPITVYDSDAYARHLPSGNLVYLLQGTLFAAPMHVDRLEARRAGCTTSWMTWRALQARTTIG